MEHEGYYPYQKINYGDVAVKAMPFLRQAAEKQSGAAGKTMAAISQLPDSLIYEILDAIPMEQKNEIVAAFAAENQEKMLNAANKMSAEHKIGVTMADCRMDQNLECTVLADKIDYAILAERFLPEIREKLLSMGDKKESMIASLINKNQQKLIFLIEEIARKQNIDLKIDSIVVEA